MYDFIIEILYEQNHNLLKDISDNKYIDKEDKINFINKYLKKNYCCLRVVKKDRNEIYRKKIVRLKKK